MFKISASVRLNLIKIGPAKSWCKNAKKNDLHLNCYSDNCVRDIPAARKKMQRVVILWGNRAILSHVKKIDDPKNAEWKRVANYVYSNLCSCYELNVLNKTEDMECLAFL